MGERILSGAAARTGKENGKEERNIIKEVI